MVYELKPIKKRFHQEHVIIIIIITHLLNFSCFITCTGKAIYSRGPGSVKWRNYKTVRRNRLMQSRLTGLPAIQTGMLVLSAATFLSTGSEAAKACHLSMGNFLYRQSCAYLLWPFQTEEVEALPLIAVTGTQLCHRVSWRSCTKALMELLPSLSV